MKVPALAKKRERVDALFGLIRSASASDHGDSDDYAMMHNALGHLWHEMRQNEDLMGALGRNSDAYIMKYCILITQCALRIALRHYRPNIEGLENIEEYGRETPPGMGYLP